MTTTSLNADTTLFDANFASKLAFFGANFAAVGDLWLKNREICLIGTNLRPTLAQIESLELKKVV